MDIVKYLRREKAILTTKTEVLQSESARLKSNLELAQKELAESRSVRSSDLIFFSKEFLCLIEMNPIQQKSCKKIIMKSSYWISLIK